MVVPVDAEGRLGDHPDLVRDAKKAADQLTDEEGRKTRSANVVGEENGDDEASAAGKVRFRKDFFTVYTN